MDSTENLPLLDCSIIEASKRSMQKWSATRTMSSEHPEELNARRGCRRGPRFVVDAGVTAVTASESVSAACVVGSGGAACPAGAASANKVIAATEQPKTSCNLTRCSKHSFRMRPSCLRRGSSAEGDPLTRPRHAVRLLPGELPMPDDKAVKPLPERKENFARKQAELGKGLFAGANAARHGAPQSSRNAATSRRSTRSEKLAGARSR